MRRRHVVGGIVVLALTPVAGHASAAAKEHSFSGNCSLSGTTHFDPPVTNEGAEHDWSFDGSGACTGALDGREVSGTPIASHIGGRLTASCAAAKSEPSPGYARFTRGTPSAADDVWILFTFH